VRDDLPLMSVSQAGRIDGRNARAFPGAQTFGQTWRFAIPEARSLLRLRLFSVYRPGDRIGVGCKSYFDKLILWAGGGRW